MNALGHLRPCVLLCSLERFGMAARIWWSWRLTVQRVTSGVCPYGGKTWEVNWIATDTREQR
jgi:hypothetical protein